MEKEKKLYIAFCAYIEACKKLNPLLWDSVASSELLEPHKKQSHFINAFESRSEFKDLIKALEDQDDRKPERENEYFEYHEYYHSLQGCLRHFFTNTGIYDTIISGKEFNKDKAFYIFLEELEEKEIEVLKFGEIFPLKIEMKKSEVLDFGNFSLLTDLSKYQINYERNFAILLHRSLQSRHLGEPSPHKIEEDEYALDGETSFSLLLFILNLYFDKPLCIPEWYEKHRSLISYWYQPERHYLEHTQPMTSKFHRDLYDKYYEVCLSDSWVDEEENKSYIDWWKFDERLDSKAEEFINSGKAPVNYLKETEIERFKEFVNKTREFLKSDIYKTKKYLKVATHYFLMAHERPDIADNLVNYVIALEALYFYDEISDERKHLGHRIANLLGGDLKVKEEIKSKMIDVYKLRCDYVHGKTTSIDNNFSGQEDWLRNVLRLSLLSFFSLSKYYDSNRLREKLLDNLDLVFDSDLIEDIQLKASEFLSLARSYDFIHKPDDNDVVKL